MKHLIVAAHPEQDSLTMGLARTYTAELEKLGHSQRTYDLVLQDTHVFRSTGFELLEHLHFDEIAPQLSEAVAERHMARVRDCARRHFPAV